MNYDRPRIHQPDMSRHNRLSAPSSLLRRFVEVRIPFWIAAPLIAVILFWPIVVFWREIRFEPAEFVEEWVKLGTGGVLFLSLLELFKHKSAALQRSLSRERWVQDQLLSPLLQLEASVVAYQTSRRLEDESAGALAQRQLWRSWKHLQRSIEHASHEEGALTGTQPELEEILEPRRTQHIVNSVCRIGATLEADPHETDELLERVQRGIDFLRNSSGPPGDFT